MLNGIVVQLAKKKRFSFSLEFDYKLLFLFTTKSIITDSIFVSASKITFLIIPFFLTEAHYFLVQFIFP